MPPSLIIIDDFLANPDVARAAALKLAYDPATKHGNYPGILSDRPLTIPGLEAQVSTLAGMPLVPAPGTNHAQCRVTMKGDRGQTGVHIDPAAYSGILYLTKPEHCAGGTDFFRHKRTGLDRVPMDMPGIRAAGYGDINRLIEDVVNRDTNRRSAWEKLFTIPMRYNRLLLFSPWLFHDAAPGFGTDPETARLVMLMFFAHAPATAETPGGGVP
ncbi:hypothetical protein GV829_07775 [Sphingomonas lacunae]|uniref:2OG-Fe(II) oxygenase n=1 Tax=Sphingomonas lacunae TaxID=2698828 RepID=A0A6M4AZA0_9SPHN|nr:DUF6445 family protein [Sphingomonas lacunae]QJQ32361.1 hypothetical protein GV829_07775 [Sphingomonas lacunae]